MACTSYTLGPISAQCHTSVGGIKEILIAPKDDILSVEYSEDSEATPGLGRVTKIQLADGKHFVTWQFRKNTGSYTSSIEKDVVIGNSSVTTEVALQFSRAEVTKRAEIQSAINQDAVIIIHDMYDKYILVGEENGVEVTNAVMQSGTTNTDLSGFTLTFSAVSEFLPRFVKTAAEGEGDTDYVNINSLKA